MSMSFGPGEPVGAGAARAVSPRGSGLAGAQHLLYRANAGDGILGERKSKCDRSGEAAIDIDGAAAHALHHAGFFERAAGEAGEDDVLAGSDIMKNSKDFDVESLDAVAGKHGLSDAMLAGPHFGERKDPGLRRGKVREERQRGK